MYLPQGILEFEVLQNESNFQSNYDNIKFSAPLLVLLPCMVTTVLTSQTPIIAAHMRRMVVKSRKLRLSAITLIHKYHYPQANIFQLKRSGKIL